jgi:cysteine desulfurase
MTFTYLDNNASAPVDEEVRLAMEKWQELFGNPHAGHFLGGLAREALEKARKQVLSIFGLDSSEWKCVFTSGAESNNMVIKGLVFNLMRNNQTSTRPIEIVASKVEHSSVDKCLSYMRDVFGSGRFQYDFLPVDSHGIVDLDEAEAVLNSSKINLVTCIHTVAETRFGHCSTR